MLALIRVTDDTTEAEIHECIALVSRSAPSDGRTARIDALLDELLERSAG